MAKENVIIKKEDITTIVALFEKIKAGQYFHIKSEDIDKDALHTEKARQNTYARIRGELVGNMDVKFRVSTTEKPGFVTIFRVK